MKQLLLSMGFSMCVLFAYTQTSKTAAEKILSSVDSFNRVEYPNDESGNLNPYGSFSLDAIEKRYRFYNTQYNTLAALPIAELNFQERINIELAKYSLQDELIYFRYKEYLNPIRTDGGFHVNVVPLQAPTFNTVAQVKGFLNRLKFMPAYFREQTALMRQGLKQGISIPYAALSGFEKTYDDPIVKDAEQSVFFASFKNKPASVAENEWNDLKKEAKRLIADSVITAFRDLKNFFEKEYYPQTTKSLAATAFPNGKEYYRELVKYHTTTNMTPDDVFETGQKEVGRIRAAMENIIREVGFKGSFNEFLNFLRTDPRFYVTTPEQLLKEASFIAKKIDGNLPSLFGKLPRAPYGIKPVPDHLAPSWTAGRGGLGTYWVNTYNLPGRPLYNLEALTLHEAVPGHHLQQALTRELSDVPAFRRGFYVNAFGEGWGLYCEYLGTELGLYKDPYSRFGRLTYEMWRACRLVIDVGLHDKGWSREQAVKFLSENSALSLHEVNTEINRYIRWPGQALSYKIGELKILELRRRAEQTLKEKFDVRAFHDLLMSEGSLTLNLLEELVNNWIAEKQKTGK